MTDEQRPSKIRVNDQLADGWGDQLEPLAALDLKQAGSFDAMLRAMSQTAFGGRNLGEAADVLEAMYRDPDCFKVLTLSGAMTIAKMGLVITEMIEQRLVDAIVSTGALMCHGLVEQTGHTHFRYDPTWDDTRLYEAGYARVYDTLELEKNLDDAETIMHAVLDELPTDEPFGSHELNRRLGGYLRDHFEGRAILRAAAEHDVPVYVPAFTDSELGLDLYLYTFARRRDGQAAPRFDPLRDVGDYYWRCRAARRLGVLTIGGGVPRNWAQQVGPLAELMERRLGAGEGGLVRFRYGVRICPEPTHWGGLSGCTYSEGISWGKFVPVAEGGRYAEVYSDATIAWPIALRAVLERLGRY
jgi:deoxyhypusine synthase